MSHAQFFCILSMAFTAPNLPTWAALVLGAICLCLAGHGARRDGK